MTGRAVRRDGRGRAWGLLVLALALAACVEDGPGAAGTEDALGGDGAGRGPAPAPAVAVVGSDYLSSSIAIVDPEAPGLWAEGVLHSGSAVPGLSVALSGDVALPSAPEGAGRLVVLDRYPTGVLSFLAPEGLKVAGQLAVGTGFAANPQDYLWLGPHEAWVPRHERNASPGRQAWDQGDDLLIVDPQALVVTGRVDLAPYADAGLLARPTRLRLVEGLVWVALDHLSHDFSRAGEGRLLALDPATRQVVHVVRIEGATNCTNLAADPARHALVVTCSGLFQAGQAAQLAGSALARVGLDEEPPRVEMIARAGQAGTRPFAFEIGVAQGHWLLALRFGDLVTEEPDKLVAYDLDAPAAPERVVHVSSTAYGLGGLLVDDARGRVYVGDADPRDPRVWVFDVAEGAFEAAGTLVTHPASGLPPRALAWY